MILHGYFRSGAAYRVRIALNLKGVAVAHVSHHLRRGEHLLPAFLRLNPQGLVPALELDNGLILTQSLAIIEWLEETIPSPALLPGDTLHRARIRAVAYAIACDTHPVQNLKVLNTLRTLGHPEEVVIRFARDVNVEGLDACEQLLENNSGPFAFGEAPTLADVCLIPQLGNARRFGADMNRWPRLIAIERACQAVPAFAEAAPERQHDAE